MSLYVSAGKEAFFLKIRSTKAHRVVNTKSAGNKLILEDDKILIV